MQKLDLTNFEKVIILFEKMILKNINNKKDINNEESRLAIIQSFEFAYEQSLKYIRRYLDIYHSEEYNNQMRMDIVIDFAYKMKITTFNSIEWEEVRKIRNNTSHDYAENNWNEFYPVAKKFAIEARFIYEQLKLKML